MYLVRWKLIWSSGKVRAGRWSKAAEKDDTEGQAWCQSKEGLATAMIETKDPATKEISVATSIGGQDFCNFEWMGKVTFKGKFGQFKPVIMGLSMVTRNEIVEVYVDDGAVKVRPKVLPDNIFAYGK